VKYTIEPRSELLVEYALAARLGHEFSNVLAVVHSAGEGVAAMPGEVSEEGAAIVICAQKAAKWAQRLTKLKVTQPRTLEPTALDALVFDSTKVPTMVDALPHVRLALERRPMMEALREISNNAEDAGATILRVTARCDATEVHVFLEDDGHGIADEARSHVFAPLFTTRAPERGKGVGLCIVHATMSAVGGSVTLECLQSGTRVVLRIPIVP
jgi:C4-dicarboxylate-specific signal transduction histidine kinase